MNRENDDIDHDRASGHDEGENGNEPVRPEDLNRHALKAFENMRFIESPDARPLRILAEYLEPAARLRREKIRDTIVFFGSARIEQKEQADARLASVRE